MKFMARGLRSLALYQGVSMKLPENDYQILKLTDAFFQKYPNPPYTEILKKKGRAYNCLLFQSIMNILYVFHFGVKFRILMHIILDSLFAREIINLAWIIQRY